MKLSEVLTVPQAAEAMGVPRRTVYRAIIRAEADGHEVMITLYGRRVILKKQIAKLLDYYYPHGSTKQRKAASVWGRRAKKRG